MFSICSISCSLRGADELLELFELTDKVNSLCGSLSGGQKQKLLLASILMHRPDVLLLDEPTNGLDPKSARLVKDLLRKLAKDGMAVMMSTHIMEVAEKMCDVIGIIHQGVLVAEGDLIKLGDMAASGYKGEGEASLEDIFLELTDAGNISDLLSSIE